MPTFLFHEILLIYRTPVAIQQLTLGAANHLNRLVYAFPGLMFLPVTSDRTQPSLTANGDINQDFLHSATGGTTCTISSTFFA